MSTATPRPAPTPAPIAVAFELPEADTSFVGDEDVVPDELPVTVKVGVLVLGLVEIVEVMPPVTTAARVILKYAPDHTGVFPRLAHRKKTLE
jgi:hypothetical protein